MIRLEAARPQRGHFNLIHHETGFKADIIVRKLQFYHEGGAPKHLRDIPGMLNALGPGWNRESLLALIETHGVTTQWQAALASGR